MARQLYKNRKEVKLALLVVELEERRCRVREQNLALVRQAFLLAFTVAFGVTTIVCALHGVHWAIPTGTGLSCVLTGAASARNGNHGN
jgi:hypothetical protein